jgi:hypothetical protein
MFPNHVRAAAPVAASILVLAVCAGGCDENNGDKGSCPDPVSGGPVVLFDLFASGGEELAPFPSDLKTIADAGSPTQRRLNYTHSMFSEGLNVLSGFGLQSVIFVPVARSIDPTTLPTVAESTEPGATMFLLDLEDLGAGETGTLDSRKLAIQSGWAQDQNSLYMPTIRNALSAQPVQRLEPDHTYAFVVTSCVTAPDGTGLGVQDSFVQFRDGGPAPEGANPDAVDDFRMVVDYLVREGFDRGDLSLVTTFTTQIPEYELTAARQVVDAIAASDPTVLHVFDMDDGEGGIDPDLYDHIENPEIEGDPIDLLEEFGRDVGTGEWVYRFDRVDKVVYGTFEAPDFLDENDMLALDDSWTPTVQGLDELQFILTLPVTDSAAGIEPPFPVLVYQHALTVCKETILAFADAMARFGIAVIGIDSKQHGARHPTEPGTCSMEFGTFMYIDNFSRSASYFMQTVIDIWSLVKMLEGGAGIDVLPDGDGDTIADLDTTRLAFAGQSMGSSMGIDAMSLEPAFEAGVVNVGGGNLLNLMLSMSMDLPDDPVPTLMEFSLQDLSMGAVVPTMADRADPLNWADNLMLDLTAPRTEPISLLYQMAAYDELVPYETFAETAAIMGIPGVDPAFRPVDGLDTVSTPVLANMAGGQTGALYQFGNPALHQFLLTCLDDTDLMYAGQLQLAVFLSTQFETGTPVIIDPYDSSQVATYAPSWEAP